MPSFDVRVTIGNKPSMRDPEGETILKDLILRHGDSKITGVRTARLLRFRIDAAGPDEARRTVSEMCAKLRIYNPLVSEVSVESEGA